MSEVKAVSSEQQNTHLLSWLLNMSNLLVALTCALFAVLGYVASTLFDTSITWWVGVLCVAILLSLLILYGAQRAGWLAEYQSGTNPSLRNRLLSLLPFLIVVPAFVMVYLSPALQSSFHSDLHSPFVDQILYHTGQPRNIYFYPEPANYYWLYHALVATVDSLLPVPDTRVWAIINMIALASTFGWVYRCLPYVLPRRRHPFLEAMLVVFVVFSVNLFGIFHALVGILDGLPDLSQAIYLILPESFRDTLRLGSLFLKYPNYNSFPLSIMYTWIGIYVALKVLHDDQTPLDVVLFCVAVVGGTAYLLIGGPFTIATLLTAAIGSWFVWILLTKQNPLTLPIYAWERLFKPHLGIWVVCGLLLVMPLIHYAVNTLGLMNAATTGTSIEFLVRNFDAILTFIGAYYPLAPFIFAAIYVIYAQKDRVLLFLLMLGIAHLLPAYFFNFTHGNEYKFVLLGVFPFALLVIRMLPFFTLTLTPVTGTDKQQPDEPRTLSLATPITFVLYSLVVLNLIGVTGFFHGRATRNERPHTINADTFALASPYSFADAFTWVREETPETTLLLLLPPDLSHTAARDTNRALLVGNPVYAFTEGITEHNDLLERLENIAYDRVSETVLQETLETAVSLSEGHPVVLIVAQNERLSDYDFSAPETFSLVFEDDVVAIYYHDSP